MRTRLCFAVSVIILLTPLVAPRRARSQALTTRIFEGIEAGREGGRREARIRFSVPIRYLRHTPQSRGDAVQIQFLPLAGPAHGAAAAFRRESLQIPPNLQLPLAEVTYDGVITGQPFLEVRFERSLAFEVRQGEDLRSLVISFPTAAAVASPQVAKSPVPADEPVVATMSEARRAMTAGDVERAIRLYTQVLALPENPETPSAQELFAFAHERKGQLARAKAEYETYLERYPDGEGADRVRQRLDALTTARAAPAVPKRQRPPEQRPLDFQNFGSFYVGYRNEHLYPDQEPDQLIDSTLFSDFQFESRLRTDHYTLRSQMTGGYRHEFLYGGDDEMRTNSLFVEGEDHVRGLRGSLGRRSLSTSGVLGRFDGVRVSYDLAGRWALGAVGGFPVDHPDQNSIGFERYFSGVSLDVTRIFGAVDAQLYAIGQLDQGTLDRAAIGGEVRHFAPGRFVAAFLDYDVYFLDLNLAQILGNWQVTPSTLLTTYLDHRLVPTLTLQNALQGQPVDGLSDLLDSLSQKELKQLAEDRTGRATSLNFGVNQSLGNLRQVSFDLGASHYSGTQSSVDIDGDGDDDDSDGIADIEGIRGTGFEFAYAAQFIQSDFLKPAGIGIVGLRFLDGSAGDLLTGTLDARYPITSGLRANPRLRMDYRMQSGEGELFSLLPSLRLDYRFYRFTFDTDFAIQWQQPIRSSADVDRWGYSMTFGLRYDY